MNDIGQVSYEFEFIRDRLKHIAKLLIDNSVENKLEAMFAIGCLHTVCAENALKFSEIKVDHGTKL